MIVFGATLNSIVYRPDFVGSPNSTRVVTAGNPDVPAPALSLGLDLLWCQAFLYLTVLSRGQKTQCEERHHAEQSPITRSIQVGGELGIEPNQRRSAIVFEELMSSRLRD